MRREPQAKLLLTTFSLPLANALDGKLRILTGDEKGVVPRVTVLPFRALPVIYLRLLTVITRARRPRNRCAAR